MNNSLFDDLVSSIKEAGAIKRKEIKTSRIVEFGKISGFTSLFGGHHAGKIIV